MTETCSTCRHWRHQTGNHWGRCTLVQDDAQAGDADVQVAIYWSGPSDAVSVGLDTRSDFGCVLHESKVKS